MALGIWVLAWRPSSRSSSARQGIEDRVVIEPARERQIRSLARAAVELREGVFHPAELGVELGLPLRLGEARRPERDPIGDAARDLEGGRVTRDAVDVEDAGQDLVQRVVGRPDALALLEAIEEALGKGREESSMGSALLESLLDSGQLGDDPQGSILQVARRPWTRT